MSTPCPRRCGWCRVLLPLGKQLFCDDSCEARALPRFAPADGQRSPDGGGAFWHDGWRFKVPGKLETFKTIEKLLDAKAAGWRERGLRRRAEEWCG